MACGRERPLPSTPHREQHGAWREGHFVPQDRPPGTCKQKIRVAIGLILSGAGNMLDGAEVAGSIDLKTSLWLDALQYVR